MLSADCRGSDGVADQAVFRQSAHTRYKVRFFGLAVAIDHRATQRHMYHVHHSSPCHICIMYTTVHPATYVSCTPQFTLPHMYHVHHSSPCHICIMYTTVHPATYVSCTPQFTLPHMYHVHHSSPCHTCIAACSKPLCTAG